MISFFQKVDLDRLNSATKYPSIPTYHALGERGRLTDVVQVPFGPDDDVLATEKIDGANTRIVIHQEGTCLIGSREEWLWHSDDLLANPAGQIVEAARAVADKIRNNQDLLRSGVTVWYGETYGGKVTAGSKNYTGTGKLGIRFFDIARFDLQLDIIKRMTVAEIASWRDHGGQQFVQHEDFLIDCYRAGVDRVPGLAFSRAFLPDDLPGTLREARTRLPHTYSALDPLQVGPGAPPASESARRKPEGIVIRTADRKKIAKIRFEDYERALRKGP